MTRAGTSSCASPIERLEVSAFAVPTDLPESDGTFEWSSTTIVLVEVHAAEHRGIGYSYTDRSAVALVSHTLAEVVRGRNAMDVPAAFLAMTRRVRNLGRPGLASAAISAVDTALWDLKCQILGLPLVTLLGAERDRVPLYGSGGFTSYSEKQLRDQLKGWVEAGISAVKMKVGREPERDVRRVGAARETVGESVTLMVDANGAYDRKQAAAMARPFADLGVTWFEEPVSSDDLRGLRLLRDVVPQPIEVAAGEYGYDVAYFRRMLEAGAVDVLQADATRCGGITGFLRTAAVSEAFSIPLSAHTAPTLHCSLCCAAPRIRHVEYFHDHVRIEQLLFEGAPVARDGALAPDRSRPGLGIELRRADAASFAI
jgi:L-alanine-DL-glutamate epimerase-like enolase superfamily enzyme